MTKAKNLLRFLKEERKSKLEVDRLSNENIQEIKSTLPTVKASFISILGPVDQSRNL